MNKLKLIKRAAVDSRQLDSIRIGDFIADEFGKSGKVLNIEKVSRHKQSYYYFYLNKSKTIMFIV
ncbi:hypothetical protein [Pedobacter agri]|uniref:hypothetical protein n=1 Tax=Pedobacter agri TaxID=454586 RepID=UPI00292CADEB|nr:hypothetical protein [Pedobacter agri]